MALITTTKEQWETLISEWNLLPDMCRGMGEKGQNVIDEHYEEMEKFVESNPSYILPERWICENDGGFGFGSGITVQLKSYNSNNQDNCILQ
jgi:hypothetical protein